MATRDCSGGFEVAAAVLAARDADDVSAGRDGCGCIVGSVAAEDDLSWFDRLAGAIAGAKAGCGDELSTLAVVVAVCADVEFEVPVQAEGRELDAGDVMSGARSKAARTPPRRSSRWSRNGRRRRSMTWTCCTTAGRAGCSPTCVHRPRWRHSCGPSPSATCVSSTRWPLGSSRGWPQRPRAAGAGEHCHGQESP